MKFDDVLEYLGEFGTYQKRIFIIVSMPAVTNAFLVLLPVFIFASPEHRCAIPSLSNDTYAVQGAWHEELINKTIPTTKDGWSKCRRFEYSPNDGNRTEVSCDKWVYDRSQYENTYMTELNLVCGKEIYRSHANLAMFTGKLFGTLGLGTLSDIIGRKKVLLIALVAGMFGGIGTAFATNFIIILVCRFASGLSAISSFITCYVICMELVGPSKRKLAANIIMLFWSFGLFVLAMLAYFFRSWQTLTLVTSVPTVLYLSYWWLLPESPRWLISKGRFEEAKEILHKVAESNKANLPEHVLDKLTLNDDDQPKAKIWEMFTTPRLLVICLIVFFNWCVVSTVYYGLSLNVSHLSGNHYLNFTIASLAETFSYILCLLLLDVLGRKVLHCSAMVLGGVSCIATLFPVLYGDSSDAWITTALAMVGRLGASGSYATIYVFTAEVFPTIVRNSAMGTSSTCAQLGGMISPYISDLGVIIGGDLKIALPLIIFGSSAVAAGLLALFLPETLNQKLTENVQDMKNLSRNTKDKRRNDKSCAEDAEIELTENLNKYTNTTRA